MHPYKYINNLSKFGSKGGFKPGLERVKALLAPFGHPERSLKVIHVAGSNGKGSTIAFLKNIYQQAGYKVGAYTSPHLINFNERIEIDGRYITEEELKELVERLAPVVEEIANDHYIGQPTYFEFVTALALIYFNRQGVDLLLLETGLGGRLDATNVIPSPLISIITGISLEHTEILGERIEDIAREKAGIIKRGRPVISGVRDKEAQEVIRAVAERKKAPFKSIYDIYDYQPKLSSLQGQSFILLDKRPQKDGVREYFIGLLGEHQIRNALLALLAVEELKGEYPVEESALSRGLRDARIPGRLEVIRDKPLILLDGAHNREGMEILVEFLKKEMGIGRKIFMVLGILRDKDVKGMVKLLKFSDHLKLIITKNKEKRALDPGVIQRVAEAEGIDNRVYYDLKEALEKTLKAAQKDDIICITGSLYTVSEAKILLS